MIHNLKVKSNLIVSKINLVNQIVMTRNQIQKLLKKKHILIKEIRERVIKIKKVKKMKLKEISEMIRKIKMIKGGIKKTKGIEKIKIEKILCWI